MSLIRPANVDPDIPFDTLRSRIIRNLIGKLDCLYDDGVYYFCDIQGRYFAQFHDYTAHFYYEREIDLENYVPSYELPTSVADDVRFIAPILKVIYVPPRHRGRNLQAKFLDYVLSVSEEECEPLAVFCDPFEINEISFADGAKQAQAKFVVNGINTPDNWMYQCAVQRERFLKAGFRNVRYHEAQVTQPWQQFAYMPSDAKQEYHDLMDALELHYEVQWDKLNQT